MNNRRKLIVGLGVVVAPLTCFAQKSVKIARIGFLGSGSAANTATRVDALRAGLRELCYVEGKNLIIEFRWAENNYDRFSELAAELVRLKVDLIVTHGTPGTRAAKQATTTIPIVMAVSGDAVATGLIASLARPGGNITGTSFFSPELNEKQLVWLRECLPRIRRVAVLFNAGNSENAISLEAMQVAARSLKLELQPFGVRSPSEFANAFSEMSKRRVDALAIIDDGMIIANVETLASLAAKNRIPATGFSAFAEQGGLMGYGVDFPALFGRAAIFVDKILKGAKPAELPTEQPTKFELILNMKAAQSLGIKFPQSLLISATKVIE